MSNERRVELTDEDAAFVEEHDLDLDDLLSRAIANERFSYRLDNPRPILGDDVFDSLRAVFESAMDGTETGIHTSQTPGEDPGYAVAASVREGGVEVRLTVGRFTDIANPDGPAETAAASGEFTSALAAQLSGAISGLVDEVAADDITLTKTDYNERRDRVTFETTIPVTPTPTA